MPGKKDIPFFSGGRNRRVGLPDAGLITKTSFHTSIMAFLAGLFIGLIRGVFSVVHWLTAAVAQLSSV